MCNPYFPDPPLPPPKQKLRRHVERVRKHPRYCWQCGWPIKPGEVYYSLVALEWWAEGQKYVPWIEFYCERCKP
jgi:hypothetical protein